MALDVKDLCRLCGKKNQFSKDLKDEDNKNILKMIQEFIQITFAEHDELPTKVCLNCEEKIESFQLFVLECYNVQEALRKICLETCEKYPIKLESDIVIDFNTSAIKSEVKQELSAEDLVNAINSDECMTGYDAGDYNNDNDVGDNDGDNDDDDDDDNDDDDNDDDDNDDDDNDDDDNVTLATLKELKQGKTSERKRMTLTETGKKHLKEISDLNTGDFVKFECYLCNIPVNTWSELREHYTKIHKSKPELFCVCGFIITSTSSLYRHVSDHRKESSKRMYDENKYSNLKVSDFVNFTCSICQKKCSSWFHLQSHSEKLHKIKPVAKCICGITLKSKTSVYYHVYDHKNPKIIRCDKCPKITKTISAMIKHRKRHTPQSERKFCCASCDKVFTSKGTLKYHLRTHMPIEERIMYSCDLCEQKFTTPSAAVSHKRVVHDKIKSYKCDLCGYACGTSSELRQHRAIHSDDRPFECRECDKRFKTQSNLKKHEDTHEDTLYVCSVCCRVLKSRYTLRQHMLVHDDKRRYACSHCDKAFKLRQTLKVHMRTHTGDKPLTCNWCDKHFSYWSSLRKHHLRCHPDKMADCGSTATTIHVSTPEVHMRTHTDDKPLTCNWCDECFSYSSSLRMHRLRCHPDKMADSGSTAPTTDVSTPEGYLKNDAVPQKSDMEAI